MTVFLVFFNQTANVCLKADGRSAGAITIISARLLSVPQSKWNNLVNIHTQL